MDAIRRNPLFVANQSNGRLQTLSSRLSRAQLVAITQLEVHAPSDAPGQWGAIHALASGRADQDVWKRNLGSAQDRLDTAESVLSEAGLAVQQAWERAIQLSSESYSADERMAAAGEVAQLRESLLGLANTRIGERALFAGDATDGTAFDSAGVYTGGPATGQMQINASEQMASTIDGSSVFQGGVDIFAALADLESALAADDPTAIAVTIDALASAHSQLVSAREEVGSQQDHVADMLAVTAEMSALFDERLSSKVAADPASAFSELMSLQTSYESALQVVAASSGAKLFDFLR